jgi:hypothetical protein
VQHLVNRFALEWESTTVPHDSAKAGLTELPMSSMTPHRLHTAASVIAILLSTDDLMESASCTAYCRFLIRNKREVGELATAWSSEGPRILKKAEIMIKSECSNGQILPASAKAKQMDEQVWDDWTKSGRASVDQVQTRTPSKVTFAGEAELSLDSQWQGSGLHSSPDNLSAGTAFSLDGQ